MKMRCSRFSVILIGLALGASLACVSIVRADESEGRPIADAGSSRYAAIEPIVLDGTGSYDPDESGPLGFAWQQVSGPVVEISEADTASPTISGFIQTDEIQECEFELVVSDGELTSLPDTVEVSIVPYFGDSTLEQQNPPFDPDKPTIIYFGGGNCINGGGDPAWGSVGDTGLPEWYEKVNFIYPPTYSPDPVPQETWRTYYHLGDMVIVYLSEAAPDYSQYIQTVGWSTGGQPATDVGIRLNRIYQDARYNVNRIAMLDTPCRFNENVDILAAAVELYLSSPVAGEPCWMDGYSWLALDTTPATATPDNIPLFVNVPIGHEGVLQWYWNSLVSSDANQFNSGVVAGAYWSVVGPGRNLQPARDVRYYYRWDGDRWHGSMGFFDESRYSGRLPEPVTVVGPEDGAFVDANGIVLSCEPSENAIGYQLLLGSDPYRVADYTIVSDTTGPPSEVITTFPFEQTFWTVRVYDAYGSTIHADPICVYPEVVEDSSETLVAHWKLDETDGETAYDSVGNYDAIVHEGAWVPGKIGGALDLNGLNAYMDCGGSQQLSPEQMTISMWLRPEHMGGMRYILTRSNPGSYEIDYAVTREYTGEVALIIGQLDSEPVSVVSNGTTPVNEWTHLAVVLDGSVASIYIDDQPDNSTVYSQRIERAGYRLMISSLGANTRFFHGLIDDVRIYDRAITP